MAGFITTTEVANMWRPLSGAETEFGQILIDAASNWIREKKPSIAADDPAAKLVVFEVVKAALLPGQWQGYASWSKTVGARTVAATLADPMAHLEFTDWHLRFLGISTAGSVSYSFPRCDY